MTLMRFLEFVTCCALPVYCPTTLLSSRIQDDNNAFDDHCQNPSGIRLPFELERCILELALLDQPRPQSLNLLLVARRTHIWLEPLFCHTVLLSTSTKAALFAASIAQSSRTHLYQAHVKHLLLHTEDLYLHPAILSTCTNIHSLTILPSSSFYSLRPGYRSIYTGSDKGSRPTASPASSPIAAQAAPMGAGAAGLHAILKQYDHLIFPHLTHLRITLDRSFGLKKIDFGLKVLENVTHLEVWNTVVRDHRAWDGVWTDIMKSTDNLALADGAGEADSGSSLLADAASSQASITHVAATPASTFTVTPPTHTSGTHSHHSPRYRLPKLTHLSLSGFGVSSIAGILENCSRLSCLVYECKDNQARDIEVNDPRFVLMPPRFVDQDKGSKAAPARACTERCFAEGREFWDRAENLVEVKRKLESNE